MAHRVDLGPRFGRAFRKQIPVGNRVRAVRLWVNANDLAAQIVRVRGRLLRVPRVAAGAFVERGVLGRERIGVVAGGQVEIAARVERDRAAGVAARASLRGDLEQHFLRGEIERVARSVKRARTFFASGPAGE